MESKENYLEDNDDTEEVDPSEETEDAEDGDVLGVVETELGGAPEYRHYYPNLQHGEVGDVDGRHIEDTK